MTGRPPVPDPGSRRSGPAGDGLDTHGLDTDGLDGLDTDALLGRLGQALPSPSPVLLALVALLSLVHLLVAAPWAVGADPFGLLTQTTVSHQTRDGAVGVIVAVAGLLTVGRTRWALPCFALASAALVGQLIAGLVDSTIAQTGVEELIHTGTVVLTLLIGLTAVRLATLGPQRPRSAELRSVTRAEPPGRVRDTDRPAPDSGPSSPRRDGARRPTRR